MSDVFLSYSSLDRDTARALAEALKRRGRSVWWDRDIPPGHDFDRVIERALREARCVVVLWSSRSVESRWVRTEAGEAAARGVLVPVRVEDVEIPLAFKRIQTADLLDWEGDAGDPALIAVLDAVDSRLTEGESSAPRPVVAPPSFASRVRRLAVLLTAVYMVSLAARTWAFPFVESDAFFVWGPLAAVAAFSGRAGLDWLQRSWKAGRWMPVSAAGRAKRLAVSLLDSPTAERALGTASVLVLAAWWMTWQPIGVDWHAGSVSLEEVCGVGSPRYVFDPLRETTSGADGIILYAPVERPPVACEAMTVFGRPEQRHVRVRVMAGARPVVHSMRIRLRGLVAVADVLHDTTLVRTPSSGDHELRLEASDASGVRRALVLLTLKAIDPPPCRVTVDVEINGNVTNSFPLSTPTCAA